MSNLRIARRFVAVGYSRQGLRRGFTTTISRMVADDHDPDDSVNDVESPDRPAIPNRFIPWSQYSQLVNRVSTHDNDITMIRMQYDFLNKRFDRLEKNIDGLGKNIEMATNKFDRKFETMTSEINRKFETMTSEINRKFETTSSETNRRFEAMDRKLTTWFLGLMGLIVVKGGIDFFSDKNHVGNSK